MAMEIFINGTPLAVTLESERNGKEVISALETWAEDQGFFIHEARVNGVVVTLDSSALEATPIDTIERLDLSLMSPREYSFMVLGELDAYIERWRQRLERPQGLSDEELKGGMEGVAWIRETLTRAVKPLNLTAEAAPVMGQIKELEIACYRMVNGGGDEFRKRMDNTLEILGRGARTLFRRGYFQLLRQSIGQMGPDTARSLVIEEGKRLKLMLHKLLPEAAAELQKGRDILAMPLVQAAAESLELLLSLLDRGFTLVQIESGHGLKERELQGPLLDRLRDLEEAFTRKDAVTLGDLLEYEIPEVLLPIWESMDKLTAALPG